MERLEELQVLIASLELIIHQATTNPDLFWISYQTSCGGKIRSGYILFKENVIWVMVVEATEPFILDKETEEMWKKQLAARVEQLNNRR